MDIIILLKLGRSLNSLPRHSRNQNLLTVIRLKIFLVILHLEGYLLQLRALALWQSLLDISLHAICFLLHVFILIFLPSLHKQPLYRLELLLTLNLGLLLIFWSFYHFRANVLLSLCDLKLSVRGVKVLGALYFLKICAFCVQVPDILLMLLGYLSLWYKQRGARLFHFKL